MGDEDDREGSRANKVSAGWGARRFPPFGAKWEALLLRRRRTTWGQFTWISPGPLLASVNDKIVKGLDADIVNDRRARWVAEARDRNRSSGDLTIQPADGDELSFLVIGDPGEQDASQYATVAPIEAVGADTDFAVIASDVIYPAGDVNQYIDGFYLPYHDYRQPIYAIPGNHDWYDGLNGFMFHFCGAQPLAPVKYRAGAYSWRARWARTLWRHPSPPDDLDELVQQRSLRRSSDGTRPPVQPGPYYAIDTKHLRIVCIDTGITGTIDREQGEWLVRVSEGRDCDKILITGKPIYVDGKYEPGEIDRGTPDDCDADDWMEPFKTVDDVVRHRKHRYVAAIGGDVHNYQHYPVELTDGRRIEYVVSGGGGAYLSATHRIGKVDIRPGAPGEPCRKGRPGVPVPAEVMPLKEQDVTLYPLRGDSLTRFIVRFAPMLGVALVLALVILGVAAVAFFCFQDGMSEQLGVLAPGSEDDPRIWVATLTGLVTLAVAAGIGAAVYRVTRAVPHGYQTFTAFAGTIALGFLAVYVARELLADEWPWIWRMGVAALLAILVPAVFVCGYYLTRDWIPAAARVAIACAPALAFGIGHYGDGAEPALVWGVALTSLFAVVVLVAIVRAKDHEPLPATAVTAPAEEPPGALAGPFAPASIVARLRSPAGRRKLRLRTGRLIPPFIGAAGVLALLIAAPEHGSASWLPAGLLWASVAIWSLLALLLIAVNGRALPLITRSLFCPYVDADEVARWIADRLEIEQPVRSELQDADLEDKTRSLAWITYTAWPFRCFMSELAEATAPPFFKSFLRIDLDANRELKISCVGVTGLPEHEDDPSVEHVIGPIAIGAAEPPPGGDVAAGAAV